MLRAEKLDVSSVLRKPIVLSGDIAALQLPPWRKLQLRVPSSHPICICIPDRLSGLFKWASAASIGISGINLLSMAIVADTC